MFPEGGPLRSKFQAKLPQDNAAAEKGSREPKEVAGLGKGVKLSSLEEPARKLAPSLEILDQRCPRESKGYRAAVDLKACLLSWPEKIEREAYYDQACKCMERALKGGETAREKR